MGSEAVAQHVGREAAENARFLSMSGEQFPETLARHASAPSGHEQVATGLALQKPRTAVFQILFDGLQGRHADRHEALLVSLAGGADDAEPRVEIARRDAA